MYFNCIAFWILIDDYQFAGNGLNFLHCLHLPSCDFIVCLFIDLNYRTNLLRKKILCLSLFNFLVVLKFYNEHRPITGFDGTKINVSHFETLLKHSILCLLADYARWLLFTEIFAKQVNEFTFMVLSIHACFILIPELFTWQRVAPSHKFLSRNFGFKLFS